MAREFRVTVEDLTTGERQVMLFAKGDYVLIPFAPCRRVGVDADLLAGTHVITVGGYGPSERALVVPSEGADRAD